MSCDSKRYTTMKLACNAVERINEYDEKYVPETRRSHQIFSVIASVIIQDRSGFKRSPSPSPKLPLSWEGSRDKGLYIHPTLSGTAFGPEITKS